jgi:RNA polymerase sigma-70 factor (ECF subfamily)
MTRGLPMPPRATSTLPWSVPLRSTDAAANERAPAAASALATPRLHDHVATLWRIVARMGVPAHHVDDVLQETFITAARRSADIEGGRERAFLIATATRLCANYRQRAHVRHEVSQGEAVEGYAAREPDAEGLLMRKRLREQLDRALAVLSNDQRAVFVLYELEGFSVPEIGDLLALPLGTVASRLGRARTKFAEAVARGERAGSVLEDP